MVSQQTVNAVAGTVNTNASGFAGIEVNPSKLGVTVYWHGRPPASVTARAMASAHANGVELRFLSAPYSLAQLLALRSAINSDPGFRSSGITVILIHAQATGLYIGVADGNSAKARKLPAIATSQISIHYFAASVTLLAIRGGRYKDEPPFSGGDFIYTTYAGVVPQCSSGFGVHFANKASEYFMLTAAHCMAESELGTMPFYVEGNGLKVGSTYSFSPGNDTVSIATSVGVKGAGGSHQIYRGPTWTTGTHGETLSNVVGATSVEDGDEIYTSGAWSGSRGPAKVEDTAVEWTASTVDGTGYDVYGALAETSNKSEIAGQGDSGGPVVTYVSDGVKAAGLVSAGITTTRTGCVGIIVNERKCFYSVLFPLMTGTATSIEADLNVAVNTP